MPEPLQTDDQVKEEVLNQLTRHKKKLQARHERRGAFKALWYCLTKKSLGEEKRAQTALCIQKVDELIQALNETADVTQWPDKILTTQTALQSATHPNGRRSKTAHLMVDLHEIVRRHLRENEREKRKQALRARHSSPTMLPPNDFEMPTPLKDAIYAIQAFTQVLIKERLNRFFVRLFDFLFPMKKKKIAALESLAQVLNEFYKQHKTKATELSHWREQIKAEVKSHPILLAGRFSHRTKQLLFNVMANQASHGPQDMFGPDCHWEAWMETRRFV